MTTELTMLAWSAVLGIVHVLLTGMLKTLQHGAAYGLSSRDEKKELAGVPARVDRAFANFMQTFPFFVAAVLTAHLANRHTVWTVAGTQLFFWARLAFLGAYAFNVIVIRTLLYLAALAGIVMVLVALT